MKTDNLSWAGYRLGARGLASGLGLWLCVSAGAQNLLKNPGFEYPLGPTNWTVGYIRGGPPDFEIRDRTTAAAHHWDHGDFGAQFRPFHNKLAHAYFTQTVTNLTPGHVYTLTGQMKEDWWSDPPNGSSYNPNRDGKRDAFLVYIEVLGGLGTPTSGGRCSIIATNPAPAYTNADVAIYATSSWCNYRAQQTPDTNRSIEVRLHLDKLSWELTYYLLVMNAYFEDLSLTP